MKHIKSAIPFVLLALIIVFLWRGLFLHPSDVPSPLINKSAPRIALPNLMDDGITTSADYLGHITLVNVWATWCYACAMEHEFLMHLSKNPDLLLYGIDYKDNDADAKKWLKEHGNPFRFIGADRDGKTAIDWGVYGTPETFVLDKKGVIRYKVLGAINEYRWENELEPLIERLRSES